MLTLITGVGAKGQVGESVARALARRGDHVLLVNLVADDANARARELTTDGHQASAYQCDLADAAAASALAERVAREHGDRLDALVNLAGGWGSSGPIADSDPRAFDRMLRINLLTAYNTTRAFFPALIRARGAIVFFASESVLEGSRTSGVVAYAAAKAGVVAIMRSVADEGRDAGVRANALAPASIRTGTNEASMDSGTRFVERDEVAATVAYLTSSASSAITKQIIRLQPSR